MVESPGLGISFLAVSFAGCSWTRCYTVDASESIVVIITKYVSYGPGSKWISLLCILGSALKDVGTRV